MEAKTLALYLGCRVVIFDNNEKEKFYADLEIVGSDGWVEVRDVNHKLHDFKARQVTPLLRPLSSMTEDEAIEHQKLTRFNQREDWAFIKSQAEATKYLLSRGIDLFALIEKGEAIDSTKL